MDETLIKEFEERASLAEQKLTVIEKLIFAGALKESPAAMVPEGAQANSPAQAAVPSPSLQVQKQSAALSKAEFRIQHLIESMQQSDCYLRTALFGAESDRMRLREQFSYLQQPSASGSPRRAATSPRKL